MLLHESKETPYSIPKHDTKAKLRTEMYQSKRGVISETAAPGLQKLTLEGVKKLMLHALPQIRRYSNNRYQDIGAGSSDKEYVESLSNYLEPRFKQVLEMENITREEYVSYIPN